MKSSSYLIPLIALTSMVARFSTAAMTGEKKTIDPRKINTLFFMLLHYWPRSGW